MERRKYMCLPSCSSRQLLVLILVACYITSYYVMDTSYSCDNYSGQHCSMALFQRNSIIPPPVQQQQQVNLLRSKMQRQEADTGSENEHTNYKSIGLNKDKKHQYMKGPLETMSKKKEINVVLKSDKKLLKKRRRHLHSKLRHARMTFSKDSNETSVKKAKKQRFNRLNELKIQEQQSQLKTQEKKKNSRSSWRLPLLNKHSQKDNEVLKLGKVEQQPNLPLKTQSKQEKPDPYSKLMLENNDTLHGIKSNLTATRKLPKALIIGVKKGGTRALLEFIRLHPDVRAVGPETHFFDRHYHKGLQWYRQQMPPTLESQLTMEKTPSYFVTREVPRRILSMSHEIKLLVVVRDPVTRAISDYAQTVSKRPNMRSFDELAFRNNATGLVDTTWGAIKIGVYAKHLENWLQFFPLNQFHFVSGERLIKDPAGEMAKVQDFLGVRRIVTENHFYFNETKGFPCLKKSEGNGSPRCLGKTKGRTHPNVDNSTIQHLRDFFRPFNMKFYQMTGVDFGWP